MLADGDLGFELIEEGDEVELIARLGGHLGHRAGVHLQGGEEVRRAVSQVLAVAPGRLAGTGEQVGPGGLACGDRGLLVDRHDDRVLGRIEIEPADLGGLRVEIGAELAHDPVLGQVRADVGAAQNVVRLGLRHPDLLGQLARPALTPERPPPFPRDACTPARSVGRERPVHASAAVPTWAGRAARRGGRADSGCATS